jgi:hypothetical protein
MLDQAPRERPAAIDSGPARPRRVRSIDISNGNATPDAGSNQATRVLGFSDISVP